MMLVARALERIGDNAVDIGEQVAFVVTGLFREFSDASHVCVERRAGCARDSADPRCRLVTGRYPDGVTSSYQPVWRVVCRRDDGRHAGERRPAPTPRPGRRSASR